MNPDTARLYEREVNVFSEWIGLSLDELYNLGVEAQTASDPSERMIVMEKLTEYLGGIKENGVSQRSGKPYGYGKLKDVKSAITKFYAINGIVLKTERGSEITQLIKRTETDKRKPTKEEIRNLISVAPNFRLKAMIVLQKDTGLRISDIVKVRFKDIKDGLNSQDGFGGFVITTEKTGKKALPCFGPESVYYLKNWLNGKTLNDEDLIFPVIREHGDTKIGDQLDARSASAEINEKIEKLGLAGKISGNGLRYFFQSQLENALNKNLIMKFCGKQIGDSSSHYSKHDTEEMLGHYRKCYHLLTVESTEESTKVQLDSISKQMEDLQERVKMQDHEKANLIKVVFSLIGKNYLETGKFGNAKVSRSDIETVAVGLGISKAQAKVILQEIESLQVPKGKSA
jgi:integrase